MTPSEITLRAHPDFQKWIDVAHAVRHNTNYVYRDGFEERLALNAVANGYLGKGAQVSAATTTATEYRFLAEVEMA